MDLSLVTQPYADDNAAADFLGRLANDPAIEHIDIVVAWTKRSGLAEVVEALRQFIARGGTIRVITGISQGGATKQGLELVREIATETFVFHHPSRTFHPKMYVGYGKDIVSCLVGSQNLTRGGLVANFEVGLCFDAVPSETEDQSIIQSVEEYVDTLIADDALCIALDDEVFSTLVSDPQYRVGDEDIKSNVHEPDEAAPSGKDGDVAPQNSMFGKSKFDLTWGKKVASKASGSQGTTPAPSRSSLVSHNESDDEPGVLLRWFKKLPASNVSRLAASSHPQGHMTLTQGPRIKGMKQHPIQASTYFRDVFFSDVTWAPDSVGEEIAIVPVSVIARGVDMGIQNVVLAHNADFASGQGNRTTMLRWGPSLSEYLRNEVNHTDDIATLEKLADGTYRLTLDGSETGPFIGPV